MPDTSLRLLRVLAVLQSGRRWPAEELAATLEVTTRTVRRDVARLRDLGYHVRTALGPAGGYQLATRTGVPTGLFDNDEAVALLLTDPGPNADAMAIDALLSARRKLLRAMPDNLRTATASLVSHTSDVELGRMIGSSPPATDPGLLTTLARACREHRRVRLTRADDTDEVLEPGHLVRAMDRWYLVASAPDRNAWRAHPVTDFRTAQVTRAVAPRTIDMTNAHQLVTDHVRGWVRRVTGTVRIQATRADVAAWVQPAWGTVTAQSDGSMLVECGADSYDAMARWLLLIDGEIEVVEPPDLAHAFTRVAKRAAHAGRTR